MKADGIRTLMLALTCLVTAYGISLSSSKQETGAVLFVGSRDPSDAFIEYVNSNKNPEREALEKLGYVCELFGPLTVVREKSFLDIEAVEVRLQAADALLQLVKGPSEFIDLQGLPTQQKAALQGAIATSPLRRIGALTKRKKAMIHVDSAEEVQIKVGEQIISIRVPKDPEEGRYPDGFKGEPVSIEEKSRYEELFPAGTYTPDTNKYVYRFFGPRLAVKKKMESIAMANELISKKVEEQESRGDMLDGALSKLGGQALDSAGATAKFRSKLEALARSAPGAFGAKTPDEAAAILARSTIQGSTKKITIGLGTQEPGQPGRLSYYVFNPKIRH